MVESMNGSDKENLRELLGRCTRPIYDRALEITGDVYAAKDATRRALREMAEAARRGECPENVDAWALMLAQRCCDEELYYKRLIDGMIADLPLTARETSAACGVRGGYGASEPMAAPQPSEPAAFPPRGDAPEGTAETNFSPSPVRRAMPVQAEQSYAPAMPAQVSRPAEDAGMLAPRSERPKESGEEESIFAPPPKKAPRAASKAVALEEDEEEDDEEFSYYEPRRRRTRKKEPEPDLFDDGDEAEEGGQSRGSGTALALVIILLTVVAAGLLWMIAVKLAHLGYLGISDFGFADWFNENLFKFY